MKKNILIIYLVFVILILSGCSAISNNNINESINNNDDEIFPVIDEKQEFLERYGSFVYNEHRKEAELLTDSGEIETVVLQFVDKYNNAYILKIDDTEIYGVGSSVEPIFNIVDIDSSDKYKEIAISEYGPSDDYVTSFYCYDGQKIHAMGKVQGFIGKSNIAGIEDLTSIVIDGSGVFWASTRSNFTGTWFYSDDYTIDANRELINIEQDFYGMNWNEIRVLSEVNLQKSPQDNQIVYQLKQDDIVEFIKTDNSKWILIETSDGVQGWIEVEIREMLGVWFVTGTDKNIHDVFKGLPWAAD